MIIISYATIDTPYEEVIKSTLIPSLEKFDLDYDISYVKDLGSWQLNTGYKSTFIKEMLLKHKQSVCFLDSDASIVEYPELLYQLSSGVDISYHNFNWWKHWRGVDNDFSRMHLLSGTICFSYNPKVLSLIDEWIEKVVENPNVWEQKVLEEIVNSKTNLGICHLPAEYCCVVMHDNSIPKYINKPVIVHHQASRKYKNRRLW